MDEFEPKATSWDFDKYLTVKGLLCTHFGKEHGEEVYELLERTAERAAEASGRGLTPGIIFDGKGGDFVGISQIQEEDEYP